MAIDFGEKRIGLAISDSAGRYAIPWETLERTSDSQAVTRLAELAGEEEVELIVIGSPRKLDGSVSDQSLRVASFSRKLGEAVEVPIEPVPEGLTTREAESRLREAGLDPRKRRRRLDALAAQIILQEVLDRRRPQDEA